MFIENNLNSLEPYINQRELRAEFLKLWVENQKKWNLVIFDTMKIEQKQLDEIIQLCASNRVRSLSAFGSVTREDFNDQSDIDLLVDFEEEDPYK